MSEQKPRYVIIDTKGRAENIKDEYAWHDILERVYRIHSTAGGNQALPEMLLRDGKIIVPRDLCSIAWDYCRLSRTLIQAAAKEAREKFPEPNA